MLVSILPKMGKYLGQVIDIHSLDVTNRKLCSEASLVCGVEERKKVQASKC